MIHQLLHGGSQPSATPLESDEEALFEQVISTISELPAFQRDLGGMALAYKEDFLLATEYTKAGFNNIKFGGYYPASGEFGARLTRAETVFASTTGSLYWSQNVVKGWNQLFSLDTNTNGLPGLPGTALRDNVTIASILILDPTVSEKIEQVQIISGGTTYPVVDRNDVQASNFYVIPFGALAYTGKNAKSIVYANFNQATTTRARLYGLEFYTYEFGLNQQ